MTKSASEPMAIVPFRGYRPKILAAFVAVNSTNLGNDIFPVLTPSEYINSKRCSIAGCPFGILVKSSFPIIFCSKVNGQWSVATT